MGMMKPISAGQYQPFGVPSCLVVGMKEWWARAGSLLKGQWEAQDRDSPEGTTTPTNGRMTLGCFWCLRAEMSLMG